MRRGRIATVGIAAALCAGLLLGGVGPAHAGKKRVKTRITLEISNTPPPRAQRGTFYYYGEVKSRKPACRRRPVTLIRTGKTLPGEAAETTSGSDGSYVMEVFVNPDVEYYTKVPRKELRSGKICTPARSPLTTRK